jgi:hypothetical protein
VLASITDKFPFPVHAVVTGFLPVRREASGPTTTVWRHARRGGPKPATTGIRAVPSLVRFSMAGSEGRSGFHLLPKRLWWRHFASGKVIYV